MADRLRDLILRINADSRQLTRELRNVENRNRRATRQVESQWARASRGIGGAFSRLSRFTGIGAAIGAGLSVRGITQQISQTLELADSIDKASARLGVGVEALQEFRFAADQSGIAANTFDKALQKFTEGVADAANGTGEALNAIRDLRLELRGADGQIRKTEDLFSDAVSALAGVENRVVRLGIAVDLFGARGASVLQMVENFEALRQKARELGIVIDQQTIKRAVEAKDQLEALSQVARAQLAPALVDLAPILVDIAEKFSRATTRVAQFYDQFKAPGDLGEQAIVRQLGIVGAELGDLKARLDEAREARDAIFEGGPLERAAGLGKTLFKGVTTGAVPFLESEFERASQRFEELQQELFRRREEASAAAAAPITAGEVEAFGSARKAIEGIEAEIDALLRLAAVRGDVVATGEVERQIALENQARQHSIDLTSEQGARFAALALSLQDLESEASAYADAQRNVNSILQSARTPVEVASDRINRLYQDFLAGRIAAEDYRDAVAALVEELREDPEDDPTGLEGGFRRMEQVGESAIRALSASMADFFLEGKLGAAELAKSISRAFLQVAIEQTVTSAIGGLGSLFGGARAGGGPIQRGVPYLVGERGPEIVVPRAPGFVVPNSAIRPAASGGSSAMASAPAVVINVRNETRADVGIRESRGPGGQREIEMVISETIARDVARGGPVARAIDGRIGTRPRGA